MISRPKSCVIAVLYSLTIMAATTNAATLTEGYIAGEVVSVAGEALGGAVVEVRDPEKGFVRRAVSDRDGAFHISRLPSGLYKVEVSLDGHGDESIDVVSVSLGSGTNVRLVLRSLDSIQADIEEIEVVASKIAKIDLDSSETTLVMSEVRIDQLPIARNTTSVAMMAAGTVQGTDFFGSDLRVPTYGTSPGFLASSGGSSVAENAYYINGMNVTNFRNGLGGSTVPFEFFKEFQIKTSGLSAEFGRATGGFINAVTKSGSNELRFGGGVFFQPDSMRSTTPDVVTDDGIPAVLGSLEGSSQSEAWIYASGPIIKDRLFFYALYNPRDVENDTAKNVYLKAQSDDAFWGGKLDFRIAPDHLIELTMYSDKNEILETVYNLDAATVTVLENRGTTTHRRGGESWIAKYTAHLGAQVSLSALVGHTESDLASTSSGAEFPAIFDNRAPNFFTNLGSWVNVFEGSDADQRDVGRLDVEWEIDRHLVRAGIDHEKNNSFSESAYSGDELWFYYDALPGDVLPTGTVPPGTTQIAERLVFRIGGSFDVVADSLYLEDRWRVSDDLTLNIGVRNERFDNRNANGETFIKMTNQWAPRIGFTWDLQDNSTSKLYGSFGRYHLPVASTVSIRLGGLEFFTDEWYVLDGLNPDDTPQLGPQIGETLVFADGNIRDPEGLVDSTVEPMYQDEFVLGYETEIGDQYVAGVSAIHRDMASAIEDLIVDSALNDYAQRNGYSGFFASGFDYYVLTNPGTDMLLGIDLDGDGTNERVPLSAAELGYPQSVRKYNALNIFVERVWDGAWFARVDYTWSKSYGNHEGYVRSDNGQSDAGMTSVFDLPTLVEGAYGDLPNDRRHALKAFGGWEFRPGWMLSGNATWVTGKPVNTFGLHPTDPFAAAYGPESFYNQGEFAPRGSGGRTSSVVNLDLALRHQREVFGDALLTAQVDIFNVFDSQSKLQLWEWSQFFSGAPDPTLGLAQKYQSPRSVRFGLQLDF